MRFTKKDTTFNFAGSGCNLQYVGVQPLRIEINENNIDFVEGFINKLGQLEDLEELCSKMTAQPIYEKFSKTNICKLDFTGYNTAYDSKNNCIIVYKNNKATIYFVNEHGKTWALSRKELL